MPEQDLSDILLSDEVKEFTITYKGKDYTFKIRELPWVRINSLLSRCVHKEEGKKEVVFDKGEYDMLYLDEALIEAPWPRDRNRIVIRRLGTGFGSKLEEHIPNPMEEDEELKKE